MILRRANIYDSNDIAKVHFTTWSEFYKDRVSPEFLKYFDFEYRKKQWIKFITDGRICYVLEEKGGSIDGFIVPRIIKLSTEENIGEVLISCVNNNANFLENSQALLLSCAMLFNVNSANKMYTWLHRESSFCDVYKGLDGVENGARIERMDSKDIIKIKIEWDDITALLEEYNDILEKKILDLK